MRGQEKQGAHPCGNAAPSPTVTTGRKATEEGGTQLFDPFLCLLHVPSGPVLRVGTPEIRPSQFFLSRRDEEE